MSLASINLRTVYMKMQQAVKNFPVIYSKEIFIIITFPPVKLRWHKYVSPLFFFFFFLLARANITHHLSLLLFAQKLYCMYSLKRVIFFLSFFCAKRAVTKC